MMKSAGSMKKINRVAVAKRVMLHASFCLLHSENS